MENHFGKAQHLLCGHNAKEFDIPFIARRMIIHQIAIPAKLKSVWQKALGSATFRHFGIVEIRRLQTLHVLKITHESAWHSFFQRRY